MNTTTAQNKAHRTSTVWLKTGKTVRVDGETYISEYTNGFTGWVIRKDWRMTGHDWIAFNAAGERVARFTSLTIAKWHADEAAA